MKKVSFIFLGIVGLFISFLVFTAQVKAAPNNNPIFATLQGVHELIEKALIPLRRENALLKDRVENLEVWVENHVHEPPCATCSAEVAVKAVNEEVAIDALRSIGLAQAKFLKDDTDQDGKFDYAEALPQLFEQGRLIDIVLGTGQKRGYVYELQVKPNQNTWFTTASPTKPGKSGDRYFFVDESGVIRFNASASASVNDQPIGG